MNKTILLVFITLALTQAAITFDSSVHCSCEELLQADCTSTSMQYYCKWTTTCETIEVDTSCSAQTSANCTGPKTGYTCGLEGTTCTEKSYSCGDFTTAETCPSSIDCYWNKSGKCAAFSSCADYEVDNCYYPGCTGRSGTCASFKCADFTSQDDCYGSDSDTTYCAWSNDSKCNSLSRDASCSDLNSYTNKCNNSDGCIYENNACRTSTCADIKSEQSCTRVRTGDTTRTLCSWSGTACADAADTSKLTQTDCISTSSQNYKWNSEGKCVECSDLVSEDSSSSYILSFIIAAILLFI